MDRFDHTAVGPVAEVAACATICGMYKKVLGDEEVVFSFPSIHAKFVKGVMGGRGLDSR